jgi:hypothetical protein
MVTWSRDYFSPDSNKDWYDLENLEEWFAGQEDDERCVRLPLIPKYYDGGYHIASDQDVLEGRHCGWIFTTPETVESTGAPLESLERQLRAEVEEYSQWANGECYGYVVERLVSSCSCGECKEWEDVDYASCFGFIGSIYPESIGEDMLDVPDELRDEVFASGFVSGNV